MYLYIISDNTEILVTKTKKQQQTNKKYKKTEQNKTKQKHLILGSPQFQAPKRQEEFKIVSRKIG